MLISPIQVARGAVGVLTTENRKTWSKLRTALTKDRTNAECLEVVDRALFIVCLDIANFGDNGNGDEKDKDKKLADLCSNFLCGTYELENGEQVGTCFNRWYDKVGIRSSCSFLWTHPSAHSSKSL
jgi:carnitine O-acetyltransferase